MQLNATDPKIGDTLVVDGQSVKITADNFETALTCIPCLITPKADAQGVTYTVAGTDDQGRTLYVRSGDAGSTGSAYDNVPMHNGNPVTENPDTPQ